VPRARTKGRRLKKKKRATFANVSIATNRAVMLGSAGIDVSSELE